MCTSQISAKVGLYWVLSMYRADANRPFSDLERETMQLVAPHVVAAARRARIGHLRMLTRVADGHGQAAAIVNAEGLVLEAEPGFAELLAKGWSGWAGPTLPTDVVAELASGKPARLARKDLILRSDGADGVILVHVRRAVPADRLTSRKHCEDRSPACLERTARVERLLVRAHPSVRGLGRVGGHPYLHLLTSAASREQRDSYVCEPVAHDSATSTRPPIDSMERWSRSRRERVRRARGALTGTATNFRSQRPTCFPTSRNRQLPRTRNPRMNRRNAVPMHVTPSHPANRDALGRARTLTPEQFARATEDGEIEGIEHLGFRLADVVAARSRAGSIK